VVDLSSSSDEGDLIADVSWDEEIIKRLFGDLNCDVLGPPDGGKSIILSDSDEEEVREEKAADVKDASSFVGRPSATTTFTDEADGTYKSNTLDRATNDCSSSGDEAGLP
jgi:hypothetical protein